MSMNPFDIPRRPDLDLDFNGAAKVDDTEEPPDPLTMLGAEEYNGLCKAVTALGRVCPLAIIAFDGAGAVTSILAPKGDVVPGDVGVVVGSTTLRTLDLSTICPPITMAMAQGGIAVVLTASSVAVTLATASTPFVLAVY